MEGRDRRVRVARPVGRQVTRGITDRSMGRLDGPEGLRARVDRPLSALRRDRALVPDVQRPLVAARSGWPLSRRDVPPSWRITATPPTPPTTALELIASDVVRWGLLFGILIAACVKACG